MAKRYDDLDLLSAMAGTAGALEVAGRYAWGGFRSVGRHVRRVGGPARRTARGDAWRAGRRAATAVRVLRGTAPVERRAPMDILGALAAAGVMGAVTVVGIRFISRGLVAGQEVPPPAPAHREAAEVPSPSAGPVASHR
jgi:hypothetical protein